MSSCYSNPSPTFQPAMRIVNDITNANPAVVTTTLDHDFVEGEIVRLKVPRIFGMFEINNLTGQISVLSSTTFSISIDSTYFDAFSIPSPLPSAYTCPQVIPIGEISSTLAGATKNVLPSGVR